MRYYPIFLDVCGRRVVVIGGGKVAERKVRKLLRAGARVRVISPELTPGLERLAAASRIRVSRRQYRSGELGRKRANRRSPLLVFAATDDPAVQRAVRHDATAAGALVNLADRAEGSDFIVPASLTRGDLHIAISTSGTDPGLARFLRQQLAAGLKKGKRQNAKGKSKNTEVRSQETGVRRQKAKDNRQEQGDKRQEAEKQVRARPGTLTKLLSLARKSVWSYS